MSFSLKQCPTYRDVTLLDEEELSPPVLTDTLDGQRGFQSNALHRAELIPSPVLFINGMGDIPGSNQLIYLSIPVESYLSVYKAYRLIVVNLYWYLPEYTELWNSGTTIVFKYSIGNLTNTKGVTKSGTDPVPHLNVDLRIKPQLNYFQLISQDVKFEF